MGRHSDHGEDREGPVPGPAPGPLPGPVPGPANRGLLGHRSVAMWTVIAGVAAVAALAVSVISFVPKHPTSSLEVQRFAVEDPRSIDGESYDISDPSVPPAPAKVDSNIIDVALRNTGDIDAYITSARARVLYVRQMEDCMGAGGEAHARVNYSFLVPVDTFYQAPAVPFTLDRQISFTVAKGAVDRLTFTIGPQDQSLSSSNPWVYVVEVSLQYGDGNAPLQVGTAALLSRPGGGDSELSAAMGNSDAACIATNKDILGAAYDMTENRSTELSALKVRFDRAAMR